MHAVLRSAARERSAVWGGTAARLHFREDNEVVCGKKLYQRLLVQTCDDMPHLPFECCHVGRAYTSCPAQMEEQDLGPCWQKCMLMRRQVRACCFARRQRQDARLSATFGA